MAKNELIVTDTYSTQDLAKDILYFHLFVGEQKAYLFRFKNVAKLMHGIIWLIRTVYHIEYSVIEEKIQAVFYSIFPAKPCVQICRKKGYDIAKSHSQCLTSMADCFQQCSSKGGYTFLNLWKSVSLDDNIYDYSLNLFCCTMEYFVFEIHNQMKKIYLAD